MNLQKNVLIVLSAVCCLISINALGDARVVKEYTTPPPTEQALPVTAIPPLYSPVPKAAPANAQKATPEAPVSGH